MYMRQRSSATSRTKRFIENVSQLFGLHPRYRSIPRGIDIGCVWAPVIAVTAAVIRWLVVNLLGVQETVAISNEALSLAVIVLAIVIGYVRRPPRVVRIAALPAWTLIFFVPRF